MSQTGQARSRFWVLSPALLAVARVDLSSDTIETYFDSHVDLWQRKLQAQSERLKLKAEETFKIRDLSAGDLLKTRIRDLRERSSEGLAVDFDKEMKNFKLKVRGTRTLPRSFLTRPPLRVDPTADDAPLRLVALDQGRAYAREGLVLRRCHDRPLLRVDVWHGTAICAPRIHDRLGLPHPPPLVQVQATRLALFPLRPLLLRHHPQFHLPMARALEPGALRRVLLPQPRKSG